MSLDGIRRRQPVARKYPTRSENSPEFEQPFNSFSEKITYADHADKFDTDNNYQQDPTRISRQYRHHSKKITPRKKDKFSKRHPFLMFFFYVFLVLFLTALSVGAYFIWKIGNLEAKINSSSPEISSSSPSIAKTISGLSSHQRTPLLGEEAGRINILLLGMAGENDAGGYLTDTIMIASIDTENNKIALLSLPRDLYVQIPDTKFGTKINAVYKYGLINGSGIKPLKKTIEEITGLEINYYVAVTFSGFEKFIDNLGGINIQVKRDIYDPRYPGPNYSYETFEIKKGLHKMDGSTALKYARERHDDPDGDFGRAKRQQQVLQAVKNKLFSAQIIFNPFKLNKLLEDIGDNIKTNASLGEMKSFLELSKQLDTQNINTAVVDAWKEDSLLKVSHIFYENSRAFILVPRVGNFSEIKELASNIFNLKNLQIRQEKIAEEDADIALINASQNYSLVTKIKKLLQKDLKFAKVKIIKSSTAEPSEKTEIFDLSEKQKPLSLDELIKKIPATLNDNNSALIEFYSKDLSDYDIVILLGKDIVENYSYQEATMEDLLNDQSHDF